MKRIVMWLLSSVTVVVLLFGYRTSTSSDLAVAPLAPVTSTGSSGGSTGSPSSGSAGASKTKTVTGSVVSTDWGPVQVQLTLQGGTITAATVLQYPSGNPRDDEINAYALPILIDETTQAQSAQIDMVSGATVTSAGYIQSLQSALDKAGV